MDEKNFKDKIESELKKLNKEKVVYFAWLCAVRGLPFLGSDGHFNFWKEEERQKHLYAIFYALDFSAAHDATDVYVAYAAYVARTSASASASAYAAAVAANAAANAAVAVYAAANAATANNIADAVNSAAAASYAASADSKTNHLESIIFNDLEIIKNSSIGKRHLFAFLYKEEEEKKAFPTFSYGETWDNFQKALAAEGCAYWAKLYKGIFADGFVLDSEALKTRLNIPKEIQEQGAAKVAAYLEAMENKGSLRLNEARIIILGEKGAGKTCLARRLLDPTAPMTTPEESTAGVNVLPWKLEEEKINVRIWDFAGHTVTHAVHQFFLSERCLYIMVYDGRTEERNRLPYWLNHMKNYGGDSKAFILVNKRDQHSVDIPINALKEQYPAIIDLYDFSIRDDIDQLKDFRNTVAAYIQNNPSWDHQKIPTNYYHVKEALEELFDKDTESNGKEHIPKKTFIDIAKKNDVQNTDDLLTSLHALGVCLWYKDMADYNTLVLNPEWISHGVYKIINWANDEKKYALTLDDFKSVFNNDAHRYPANNHPFLFELMKHYELAYETEEDNRLIIPHLLKEDRPSHLPDFPVGESLMLRYKAEQPLPPNTISRFIVRHNREIKKEGKDSIVWRYGVVLENGTGDMALVREEDRIIRAAVKGNEKTQYISDLRKTLNDIFASYKSKKPDLEYRIEALEVEPGKEPRWLSEREPFWLSERVIQNYTRASKPTIYDSDANREITIQHITYIFNIDAGVGPLNISPMIDNSKHHTFNFNDCNITLQGQLNDLSHLLEKAGNQEEAKEFKEAADMLEKAEQCSSKEEVKKKGVLSR